MKKINCLEIFSGAGGLAKGLSLSGVNHSGLVEFDKSACQTLIGNYESQIVHNIDIKKFDFKVLGKVNLVAGGPPCQPFSLGGKHKGNLDSRDMFPYACKAISSCIPKAFIFENVKGLLRKSFLNYFSYIILRLTYPEVEIRTKEAWENHLLRLDKIHTSGKYDGIKYNVIYKLIDAANYGIPQRRERVIIVGIRNDLGIKWSFPKETHSLESLLWTQYVSHEYWEKHNIEPSSLDNLDSRTRTLAEKMKDQLTFLGPELKPWKTVRDQLSNIPEPNVEGSYNSEHILRNGARSYPGHTGSYFDLPAKAIKAGDHGVPGGENMIRYPNGNIRYFTTFEAKRIQTFPDDYKIFGSWTESMRQIGNAVPVELSHHISKSLISTVWGQKKPTNVSS